MPSLRSTLRAAPGIRRWELPLAPPLCICLQLRYTIVVQDGGSDASSTISRLGFERAMLDARTSMRGAVAAQAALFREMCKTEPRLRILHTEAVRHCTAAETAVAAFAKVFAIDPQVGFWGVESAL